MRTSQTGVRMRTSQTSIYVCAIIGRYCSALVRFKMREAIFLLAAVLTALQGTPDIISILHSMQDLDSQPIFSRKERICLALCSCAANGQEEETTSEQPTSSEMCFSVDECADLCDRVCCANISGRVTTMIRGDIIVDQQNCVKHSCEQMTGQRVQWKQTAVECNRCSSQFINIPDQCCPLCIGVNDPVEPGEWGEWSMCSVTCGEGLQSSTRDCYEGESKPAPFCPVPTLRTQRCYQPCPIACEWEWSGYSACSASCGGGVRTRQPIIVQEPQFGGRPCPLHVDINMTDTSPCNDNPCTVPCDWVWSEMSECTVTCNGGTRYRYPILTQAPANGGRPCPKHVIKNKTEKYRCNEHPCPVGCWWRWGPFSDCSEHCEDGHSLGRERFPVIIQPPLFGGRACPEDVRNNKSDEMECHDEACSGMPCEKGQSACDGECIPDRDQDCIPDDKDNCPEHPNRLQGDSDGDGQGNVCDNCPNRWNSEQTDTDFDGRGDACDNCRYVLNPYQENRDNDAVGNVCDTCVDKYTYFHRDQDKDGVGDLCDNCPFLFNPDQEDRDGDFVGYLCEADKDADRIANQYDNCPLLYNPSQLDTDRDGYGDACDNCALIPNKKQTDSDGDGYGNACGGVTTESVPGEAEKEKDTVQPMEEQQNEDDEMTHIDTQPSETLQQDSEEFVPARQQAVAHCG